jgi:RNA polymerase sigma-70 factor (ECF subfamily)
LGPEHAAIFPGTGGPIPVSNKFETRNPERFAKIRLRRELPNSILFSSGLGAECPAAEDARIAAGLREGLEDAYEALVARFQQPVYSLVYRLMGDPADAYDVVQEVFFKVFRNIGTFRSESSLKTWIYRIAVNEVHNYRRWFFRHRRQEVMLEGENEDGRSYGDTVPDRGRSPFEYVLDGEKRALIEEALKRINPIFRAAVVLRDTEDLSYEEIAEILNVSLGTVKSRITRGREALRRQLEGRLEPEPALQWDPAAG